MAPIKPQMHPAVPLRLPQALKHPLVQQQEELFLHLRIQPVDLIQEEDAVVRVLHQAGPVLDGAGEGALAVAEELGQEQLGVLRVVGAVEGDDGGVRRDGAAPGGVVVHAVGEQALSAARGACNQGVQAVGGIEQRRLCLLHAVPQAPLGADQVVKRGAAVRAARREGLLLPRKEEVQKLLRRLEGAGGNPPVQHPLQMGGRQVGGRPAPHPGQRPLPVEARQLHAGVVGGDPRPLRNGGHPQPPEGGLRLHGVEGVRKLLRRREHPVRPLLLHGSPLLSGSGFRNSGTRAGSFCSASVISRAPGGLPLNMDIVHIISDLD